MVKSQKMKNDKPTDSYLWTAGEVVIQLKVKLECSLFAQVLFKIACSAVCSAGDREQYNNLLSSHDKHGTFIKHVKPQQAYTCWHCCVTIFKNAERSRPYKKQ